MDETAVGTHVKLEHPKVTGGVLWRNNVGALPDRRGVPVRYGLANDSKKMNDYIKSSDYVGITPTLIQPHHVGKKLGIFTAIETKETGWIFPNPTNKEEYEHCVAQFRFHELVWSMGGLAGFATCVADHHKIIGLLP